MSKLVHDKIARGEARVVPAPAKDAATTDAPRNQVDTDRNFELPTALYVATVGCYLAFLAITWMTFAAPMLAIPMAIFAVFIAAGFGVPTIWTRLKGNVSRPLDPGTFARMGVTTNTGPCTARDAVVQMLILPVLIVVWGCAVAIIAAIVT